MNKLHLLTVIAGLTLAATTIGAQAQVAGRGNNNNTTTTTTTNDNGPRRQTSVSQADCADEMGHMRSVHRADIDAINGQPVFLIRVCEDLTVVGRNNYGALFVNGNVDTLRLPIARNRTLTRALGEQKLDQNDVVSLRFGRNDSIVLYVYDRDMR